MFLCPPCGRARPFVGPGLAPASFDSLLRSRSSDRGKPQPYKAAAALQSPGKNGEGEGESPHELLYKIINFLILVGALGYLLRKPLMDFFRQRALTITESLRQGRHALSVAQDRLSGIEVKLANLDAEIRTFKDSAGREMELELQRLRQAAKEESERTLAFARAQIDVAARAAMLELKRYLAHQAVGQAEGLIRQRLDDQGRRRLVRRFVEGLGDGGG